MAVLQNQYLLNITYRKTIYTRNNF